MIAETFKMERILHILKQFWMYILRFRARALASIYAGLKKKSSPACLGKYTIFYETYSRRIEETCRDLNVVIPDQTRHMPNWFERKYMSLRFGWPDWPVRMARYNGKMLEEVSVTVDEMVRSCQYVWGKAEVTETHKEETPKERTRIVKPVTTPRALGPVIHPKPTMSEVEGAIMDNSF